MAAKSSVKGKSAKSTIRAATRSKPSIKSTRSSRKTNNSRVKPSRSVRVSARKIVVSKATQVKSSRPTNGLKVAQPVQINGKHKDLGLVVDNRVKSSKALKVPSGLSKSEREHYRHLLLDKRREILGDVGAMENEAFKGGQNLSNMPIHMADVGTDNFEQEFTLGLIESERVILREIQDALDRIEEGSYGVCAATGKPIGKPRLEAKPWAKYCIDYERLLEQGKVRPEMNSSSDDDDSSSEDDDE